VRELEQENLFEPIKSWLENKGFRVLITHNKKQFGMFITDLISTRSHVEPDLAGIRSPDKGYRHVLVVEVETDPEKMLEIIGKCMLWKTAASYVYIAFPKEKCPRSKLIEKLGIGLLGVSDTIVEEVITLEDDDENKPRFNITELHPLDHEREGELCKQLERMLISDHEKKGCREKAKEFLG